MMSSFEVVDNLLRGNPADRVGQVVLVEQIENPLGDQPCPDRVERDLLPTEVVRRFLARGERELAKLQCLPLDQLL